MQQWQGRMCKGSISVTSAYLTISQEGQLLKILAACSTNMVTEISYRRLHVSHRPGTRFIYIVKCEQRKAMTLSQLLSSFLGTPKSDNLVSGVFKSSSIALSTEKACVWWIQQHICCHCLSPQSPPTPGQMRLYAVVGVASLPIALPMHSSVEAHSSFQLHQTQWRYSYKYPFRLGDNLKSTFVFLNIRKLSSFVWSWWLPWSLKRLRQKEAPSRWWKTGEL